MRLYEVGVNLDTGYTLHVVVAAMCHREARAEVRKVMSGLCYPGGLTAAVNSDSWTVQEAPVESTSRLPAPPVESWVDSAPAPHYDPHARG